VGDQRQLRRRQPRAFTQEREERILLFSSSLPDVSQMVKKKAMLLLLLLFSIAGVGQDYFLCLEIRDLGQRDAEGNCIKYPQGQTRKAEQLTLIYIFLFEYLLGNTTLIHNLVFVNCLDCSNIQN
jgi:hypothetical protein